MRKIAREEVLDYYQFPQTNVVNDVYFYPDTVGSYVLTVPSRSTRGHVSMLTKSMHLLIDKMKIDSLLFLGDTPTPWRYQQNDYKPVKAALDFLASKKIGKRFNGGIEIFTSWLPDYIPHIFWLVRCNAALPAFHFTDCDQTIMGSICKYGNLHIDALNDKADKQLRGVIPTTSFQYTDLMQCGTSAIEGRRTIV